MMAWFFVAFILGCFGVYCCRPRNVHHYHDNYVDAEIDGGGYDHCEGDHDYDSGGGSDSE